MCVCAHLTLSQMEGWLQKLGEVGIASWKKRWFVLDERPPEPKCAHLTTGFLWRCHGVLMGCAGCCTTKTKAIRPPKASSTSARSVSSQFRHLVALIRPLDPALAAAQPVVDKKEFKFDILTQVPSSRLSPSDLDIYSPFPCSRCALT